MKTNVSRLRREAIEKRYHLMTLPASQVLELADEILGLQEQVAKQQQVIDELRATENAKDPAKEAT